ncbi:hypothetical protein REH65_31050 [Saccharopolyspora sp. ID03-671]|uniref:ATP-dependent DNA ligase n=1 Tax=Saccharopolyspora sp. ID03-671 TaxID=3073066 RepID=UPI00324B6CAE
MAWSPEVLATAQPRREVPAGPGWAFEPKLDGWRGLLAVERLWSRTGTNLGSRFPEILAAVAGRSVVLDGEIVAYRYEGRIEFAALQMSPAHRRQQRVGVYFAAFDLLAAGGRDWRRQPYLERRAELVRRLDGGGLGVVQPVPMTLERDEALWWMSEQAADRGIEGLVAKPVGGVYQAGRRSGWVKVRRITTSEAVVLGVSGPDRVVLGLADLAGRWRAVGLSQPVPRGVRAELAAVLRPRGGPELLPGVIAGLPGHDLLPWQPCEIEVVAEVETDTAVEYGRWRHQPRVLRIKDQLG